ncbi:AraC family transcriptional regulator [Amycolatopsis sp. QT-25]|uniref:helix-turn-helix transcriptional regulator n=1 Tax=Amycolatopsis sp. QT-25 TaxID=3034022 RepID=UPI0023EDC129|nr:AraC family transcriptional regulator [Amycolatopsis sp. QT-25]WET82534.1 AraC family transcriptional regulator [Amycolatopsis sp. QT-25]
MTSSERAVERAVRYMFDNFNEKVTVEDLAQVAMFSKFYFTRMFQRVTGISPGRFLTAIRLQEAKRLLLTTSINVIEVSHLVGYSSVGTFSTTFSKAVGVSPTEYRSGGGVAQLRCQGMISRSIHTVGTVHGRITAQHPDELGMVFVGVFPGRIPQGRPIKCTVLDRPGHFRIDDVPSGEWYVLSHSLSKDRNEVLRVPLDGDLGLSVGACGPVTVGAGVSCGPVDLTLKPKRTIDPPVVLALLKIRSSILTEVG